MKYTSMFDRYLQALENTGDIMLRYYFQKNMMKQSLLERQEREQLINDVAYRVLSMMSVTVDAEEVFKEIDELNKKIDTLNRK